jgi:hypothetical protein
MNEYEATWAVPGLMTLIRTTHYKNHLIQIYYNTSVCNYTLFIQNGTNQPYEKHFIVTADAAWEIAIEYVNTKLPKKTLKTRIIKFLKGIK